MERSELGQLADEILTEMYDKAEPPLDFMELRENPDDVEPGWYEQHYLSEEAQKEIFEAHVEAFEEDRGEELTTDEHTALVIKCIVDLGPSSIPPEEE